MNRATSMRNVLYHGGVAGQSKAEVNETTGRSTWMITGIKPFNLLRM